MLLEAEVVWERKDEDQLQEAMEATVVALLQRLEQILVVVLEHKMVAVQQEQEMQLLEL
tara:strand:+ start:352 stop:528 length:177 start_codon:yes stop_codon:yes gene_type:complete